MEPIAVSVEEAAKLLGVSKPTVYSMIRGGGLPHLSLNRRTLIPVEGLREWVNERAGGRYCGGE